MRQFLASLLSILFLGITFSPTSTYAAAGITPSGGGTKTVGQQFTITVTASGTTFDSLQGLITVSGPVSVVSFTPGSATWLPGKTPGNGSQFVGIVSETSSITVAKITLKGTKEGSGSVSVSGVKLASKGSVVSTTGGSTNFTIDRAPVPPSSVSVTSSTHPDQNVAYEARTISLQWTKASGVTGFSYVLDQSPTTTPATKATSGDTSVTYSDREIGTYYFHIRAQNADGWGGTTHYKITIKEPDPKIDETVTKPVITGLSKTDTFTTDLDKGTVTGLLITGKGPSGYTIQLTPTPAISIPDGKSLSVPINDQGEWQLIIDYPITTGFYKLTAQAIKDKTLSPVSDVYKFEASLAKGGTITQLTEADAVTAATPTPVAIATPDTRVAGVSKTAPVILLILLVLGGAGIYINKKRKS